jgi:Fe-S-cluster containining protein
MGMAENLIWMRDFNRRFDEEVKQLYAREPFWQVCQKCPDGYCCGHIIFPVQKRPVNPFLAEDWWMKLEQARDNFSANDRKLLRSNILSKRKDCIWRFGNRCAIHAGRPWTCRFHPYTISFHPSQGRYPVGEVALPSCPGCASAFGIAVDETYIQKPAVIARDLQNPRLVQLKLKKRKPTWLIDASDYLAEYESRVKKKDQSPPEWQELLALAKEAGGAECEILPVYIEKVLGLQPLSNEPPPPRFPTVKTAEG